MNIIQLFVDVDEYYTIIDNFSANTIIEPDYYILIIIGLLHNNLCKAE